MKGKIFSMIPAGFISAILISSVLSSAGNAYAIPQPDPNLKLRVINVELGLIDHRLGVVLSPTSVCVKGQNNPGPIQEPPDPCVAVLNAAASELAGIYYWFTHNHSPHHLIDKDPIALEGIIAKSGMISILAQSAEKDPGPTSDPAELAALKNIVTQANTINSIAINILYAGSIIIEKDTVGGDGTFTFYTNSTAHPTFSITTVGGVGTMALHNISGPGVGVAIGETGGPSNFAFTSVSCSNVVGSNIFFLFLASQAVTVQLTSASNVVKCTFVNTAGISVG